nr:septin and tuftelin-interacting protein 1 homolog isoform X2 [Drosophila kikkawai]
MWFEILPGAVIITTLLSVPIYAMYGLQKVTIGNAFRRNMDERFSRVMYQRDFRLTDNPYLMNGLEQIPDEEEDQKDNQECDGDYDDPELLKKRKKEEKLREKQQKEEEKKQKATK